MKKYINRATKWPRCIKPVFSFSKPYDVSLKISHYLYGCFCLYIYNVNTVYIADSISNDYI